MLEEKISQIFNADTKVFGSGRTDRFVHARGQVIHFDGPLFPVRKLRYALNKMLPSDLMILTLKRVNADFHARYSATAKEYEYVLLLEGKDPFSYETALLYPQPFDLEKVKAAAATFMGVHNFQNFTSKSEDQAAFVREITAVKVNKRGKKVSIKFSGNGFMRGQIRFMVGALLAINEGREDANYIQKKLEPGGRRIIPYKVSGHGLYLNKVWY